MTATASHLLDDPASPPALIDVEIVVPVYNEEAILARSIYRLHAFLSHTLTYTWQITIADNASTDLTPELAEALADELPGVEALHLVQKGRGRALRTAWLGSRASVVAYMDVDLSTDLRALAPLLAAILSGHSELAIGSRLAPGARVERGPKREFISRSYNHLLRTALRARFSDAQCGFKALRADVARQLLPEVRDEGWFFDTELLVLAQRRGLRTHEIPVDWVDDPDSRVDIVSTAWGDLKGVARLAAASPLARFGAIGVASTLAYAVLFLALAGTLGAATASALGLAVTAVANTAANRRLTFGIRGRTRLVRQHAAGLIVFVIALGLTSGALDVLRGVDPQAPRLLEVSVLVAATLVATITRYLALASWVFRLPRRHGVGGDPLTSSL